ncbi:Unknown protein [Striga hermonthica]|uniref:Uncharacterized protein n=1 Tax=Striga hermonthica TaxID=68872 RepID=A0A9N7NFG4_STRHE|nr:Unknown protein [Striga hermonthica]
MANTWKTDSPLGMASSKAKTVADLGYSIQCPMPSTMTLSASTVLATDSGTKLSVVQDSYHLNDYGHCADTEYMNATHVARQDALTSAKQLYLSLMSGDPTLYKACKGSSILVSDVVNSHENWHLHECCSIATRTVLVSKRLMEYGEGLSEYNDRNLKKHKNNSYSGNAGLGPLLPSAAIENLKQSASTAALAKCDTKLSHVESLDQIKNHGRCSTDIERTHVIYQATQDPLTSANQSSYLENYGCSTLLKSSILVTDEATKHEIFHVDENNTVAMKLIHTSKRKLEQSVGNPEYTNGILKKRQKYCCTVHEVIIPDHLKVTNTECVDLSSLIVGSGAFFGLLPHKATDSNVELSIHEEPATLNQMYARDENQGMALHSATNGILDVKMGTNKENGNSPSVSQAAELAHEILDSFGRQYDVTSLPSDTYSNVSTSKVQFTVKLAGYSLSSQEDLALQKFSLTDCCSSLPTSPCPSRGGLLIPAIHNLLLFPFPLLRLLLFPGAVAHPRSKGNKADDENHNEIKEGINDVPDRRQKTGWEWEAAPGPLLVSLLRASERPAAAVLPRAS